MSVQATGHSSTEQDRQHLIEEMLAEHGPNWCDPYKPGTFGCHELLDRTALAADAVEHSVLSHPACIQNPDWYALAEQAVTTLRELYQRVGAAHLEEKNNNATNP